MGASLRDRASRAAHGAAARLRHPATIACAYAAIAIFTFGHVAGQARECWRAETGEKVECPIDVYARDGLAAAVFWPLYWSWELQQ